MTATRKKPTTGLPRVIGIGLSLIAGLTFGVLAVIATQSLIPQKEQASQDVAQRGVSKSSTTSSDSGSTADSSEFGRIQNILDQPSVFDQQKALYSMLSSATAKDLKDLWIQSQSIERESHRETVQHGILSKLATISPNEVLEYIDEVSIFQTDALLTSLFSEWSISHLEKAIEATGKLVGTQRSVALEAILETRDDLSEERRRAIAVQLDKEETYLKRVSDTKATMSLTEPQSSWDTLVTDEVEDYLQTESLLKVAEAWREQIGFEVLSNIYRTDMEDNQLKQQLIRTIVEVDLPGALDYTRGLTDESEKFSLSRTIVRAWARSDALAALLAVSTFEPTSIASDLNVQIAMVWGSTKPNEAIENIEALSDQYRLNTLESAFAKLASLDPKNALARVSSVEHLVANTSSIILRIVRAWSYDQPRDATDWVLENYAREDPQLLSLLRSVLRELAPVEPETAFEIALEHSTGGRLGGFELDVLRWITYSGNLELAKELIPRVHEDSISFAYVHVGGEMVKKSQADDALELGRDLNETQQSEYHYGLMRVWARENPKNLYEKLDKLPTDDLKSFAAKQLISSNTRPPYLSDDQIKHAQTFVKSDD